MSQVNLGRQTVLFRYRTPLVGKDLATMNAGVLYPGVYAGLQVTKKSATTLEVQAGEAMVSDSSGLDGDRLVKISFAESFVVSAQHPRRFLVLRYVWADVLENYADVLSVDAIEPTDVLLAVLEWTEGQSGWEISSVDYSSATKGFTRRFEDVVNNLAISIEYDFDRSLRVAKGRYVIDKSVELFDGGMATFAPSFNDAGRWDFLGVRGGSLVIKQGVEGGGVPEIGDFVPVCAVHVRKGVTNLLGTDIVDARPFMFFMGSGYARFSDIAGGYDNEYGTTRPDQVTDIVVSVSGDSASVQWARQLNLTNFMSYHVQVSPDGGVSWFPPSASGYRDDLPGQFATVWSPSIELKGLPHTGSKETGYSAKAYLVRVRQATARNVMSAWSVPVQFETRPITYSDIGPEAITDAAIDRGSLAYRTIANFNNRNDRISAIPPDPVPPAAEAAVDHTENIDGSVNISFEWNYDGTEEARDIDGFIVLIHQDTSPVDYTFGSNPVSENAYYLPANRTAFILYGAPKDKYYTLGVQAYRIVDSDIDASGVLKSNIVKPPAGNERPYYPLTTSPFVGDVGSTVTSPAALSIIDVEAPDRSAANLAVSVETDGAVEISWGGFVDSGVGIAGYRLFRADNQSGDPVYVLRKELAGNVFSFVDKMVEAGKTYRYNLTAFDRNGNECPKFPDPVSAAVAVTAAPPAPASVSAVGYQHYVELTWTECPSAFVKHYVISISNDAGGTWPADLVQFSRIPAFRDYGTPSILTNRRYRIRAVLTTGHVSPESALVGVDTSNYIAPTGSAPSTPSASVVPNTDGSFSVSIAPTSLTSRIFRRASDSPEWLYLGTVVGQDFYVDRSGVPGNSYSFAVDTVSPSGAKSDLSAASVEALCVDNAPPTAPNMNSSPLVGAVRLSWQGDRRPFTKYLVYRSAGSWVESSAILLDTVFGDSEGYVSYTDNVGALTALNYAYKLKAVDAYGNVSSFNASPSTLLTSVLPEFPPDSDLELFWTFDGGKIYDVSRHSRSAKLVGTGEFVPGRSGTKLVLNNSGYVEIDAGKEIDLQGKTGVSFSIWTATESQSRYVFRFGTEAMCGVNLVVGPDGGGIVRLSNYDGFDGNPDQDTHDVILPPGTFSSEESHYLLVVDNSTLSVILHKDGGGTVVLKFPSVFRMPFGNYGKVVLGSNADGLSYRLIGSVYGFRIYSTALQPKHAKGLHQYVNSAASGIDAAVGTIKYRSPSAPSVLPNPDSVAVANNPNGSLDITLFWDPYIHGEIPANFLVLFMRSDPSQSIAQAAGGPTADDTTISVAVNPAGVLGSYTFQGLSPSQSYSFAIAAARVTESGAILTSLVSTGWVGVNLEADPNYVGNVGGVPTTELADVTPPSMVTPTLTPRYVNGTPAGAVACSIEITWSPSTDPGTNPSGMEGYDVYRSLSPAFDKAVLLGTIVHDGSPSYKYVDLGLEHGQTYYYAVKAFDKRKNMSGIPGWVSAQARNDSVISPPAAATFTATRAGVRGTWDDMTPAPTAGITLLLYEVSRKIGAGNWEVVYEGFDRFYHEDVPEGFDHTLFSGYAYRVRVKSNQGLYGAYSSDFTVDASGFVSYTPVAPTVVATASKRSIHLSWDHQDGMGSSPSLGDSAGYIVWISRDGVDWYTPKLDQSVDTGDVWHAGTTTGLTIQQNALSIGFLPIPLVNGLPQAGGQAYRFKVRRLTKRGGTNYADSNGNATATVIATTAADIVEGAINKASQITDGAVNISKLSVLAQNYVNNPTTSGNINGWGNISEEGTGTPIGVAYDATEKAMRINTSSNRSSRSVGLVIDHHKMYKVSAKVKKSAVTGQAYVGLVTSASAISSYDGSGTSTGTGEFNSIDPVTRAISSSPITNFYSKSWSLGACPTVNYETVTFYVLGAYMDPKEMPLGLAGCLCAQIVSPTMTYLALRFLNWANTENTNLFIKDISVAEVGGGLIVTDNLVAGAVTAVKMNVMNLEVDGTANVFNLSAGLVYSTKIAGSLPAGQWVPTTPGGLNKNVLNYFDLNEAVLRIGDAGKWFYVDPANKGGSGFFWEVKGSSDNYIRLTTSGSLEMRLSVFEIKSSGNLLFGSNAMVASRYRELYLDTNDQERVDHTAVVVSTDGTSTFVGTEKGYLFQRNELMLKVGSPSTANDESTAPTTVSILPTGVSLADGMRLSIGMGFNGHTTVIGNTRNTDAGALSYRAYMAYDCYWDDALDQWAAVRTTLTQKWMTDFGYHTNKWRVRYYAGAVASPWADSAWTDVITVDNAGVLTTGRVITSRLGLAGTYIAAQVQGVWSIGSGYAIDTTNNHFGTNYGIVYAHTNAGTGALGNSSKKPVANEGHQLLFTDSGTANAMVSLSFGNFRTVGGFYANSSLGTEFTNLKSYYNLAAYSSDSSNVAGTIKITLPVGFQNTMIRMVITGYDYSSSGAWELELSGYPYPTPTWRNTSAVLRGPARFNSVRFGYDGTYACIWLTSLAGAVASDYTSQYPKVVVREVFVGHTGRSADWHKGWAVSMDTAANANASTVKIDKMLSAYTDGVAMYANGVTVGAANSAIGVTGDTDLISMTSGNVRVNGNIGSNCDPVARLDLGTGTTGSIQAVFARGISDSLFHLHARVGSGSTTDTEQAFFGLGYYGTYSRTCGISFIRGGTANGYLDFLTSASGVEASSRMRIDKDGNVAIGTVYDTSYKLRVDGAVYGTSVAGGHYINRLSTTKSGAMLVVGHSAIASATVNNEIVANSDNWYPSFIRMYYNEGIGFHTANLPLNTGAILYSGTNPLANGVAERMRLDNDGNLSIGHTDDAGYRLRVSPAYAKTDTTSRGGIGLMSNDTTNPAGMYIALIGGASQSVRKAIVQTTEHNVGNSGTLALQPNGGDVAIGTTDSAGARLRISGGNVLMSEGYELLFGGNGASIYGHHTNKELRFHTDNTERVRFTPNGDVVIGTTDPMGYRLHLRVPAPATTLDSLSLVSKSSYYDGTNTFSLDTFFWRVRALAGYDATAIRVQAKVDTLYRAFIQFGDGQSGGSGCLVFGSGSSSSVPLGEAMRLDVYGNLAIGITAPTSNGTANAKLIHLHNPSDSWSVIRFSNTTTGSGASQGGFCGMIGGVFYVSSYYAGNMVFTNNSAEVMRFNSSQEVGINVADPTGYRLNVGGILKLSSLGVSPNNYGSWNVAMQITQDSHAAIRYNDPSNSNRGWQIGFHGTNSTFNITRMTGLTTAGSSITIDANCYLTAPRVYGAVGNDFADKLDMGNDGTDPGYVVSYVDGKQVRTTRRGDPAVLGIVSDTNAITAGAQNNRGLPIAVAGFVLVYVDRKYPTGTRLTVDDGGRLTRARAREKVLATFIDFIRTEEWNGVKVSGRALVKVVG